LEPPGYRRQLIEMQISRGFSAATWEVDREVGVAGHDTLDKHIGDFSSCVGSVHVPGCTEN